MDKTRLGRTGMMVTRTGFGALPIQRLTVEEAVTLLRGAYEAGVNFFDTARAYSDSEYKIGQALSDVRSDIMIATKSHAGNRKGVLEHVEQSLGNLKTDYIDILQLHNPKTLPDADDPESAYAGLLEAKQRGLVRFVGITSHTLEVAKQAVASCLFDTLQYPLSMISSDEELALAAMCKQHDVGLIAMKAMCGGLVTNAAAAFAFLRQYANIVPIWGMQRIEELQEFVELEKHQPVVDDAMRAVIDKERKELSGDFCRGCGYCLPCPAEIPIPMAARMSLLVKRAPYQGFLSDEWKEKMHRIDDCQDCGHCVENCPYDLDTPSLLRRMLVDYDAFCAEHATA